MIDTGGIEPDSNDIILSQMREQAEIAIATADVIMFIVDVRQGLQDSDSKVADVYKRQPYHYDVVNGLVKAAKENNIDFAVDVYPYYGSDADVALTAGYDVRHGLIGSGVYASHGYERSHVDGVKNTFELLKAYLG